MRRLSPSVIFFVLPFFLMAGVALQSAGLYLCLVIAPLYLTRAIFAGVRRVVLSTAILLALCYLIPVLTQSIVAAFADPLRACVIDPPRIKECHFSLTKWLKSPVSAAFLGLSVGWLVLTLRSGEAAGSVRLGQSQIHANSEDEQRFRSFALGLFYSTLLISAYGVVQHISGFNLLTSGKLLDEHRMANGQYRIFAFFGHPLSLAGASLVWFSVALFALLKSITSLKRVFSVSGWLWFSVAVLQSALVYMSGGRTALAVVILFWLLFSLLIAWFFMHSRLLGSWIESHPVSTRIALFSLFALLLAAIGFAAVSFAPQLSPRGIGGGTMGQGALGDRPLFWQTYLAMWSDSPILGQGYFAIEHGVRTDYYVRGGLAALRDKFNAHNIFLEILAVSGVAGLMAFLAAIALIYMNLRVLSGNSTERRALLGGLVLAMAANLMHGLTQNTFFDSAVTACYLGLIGLFVIPPARFMPIKAEVTLR